MQHQTLEFSKSLITYCHLVNSALLKSSLCEGKMIYTSLCTSWQFAGGVAVLQQLWQNDCLSHYYEEEVIACEKQHNMRAPKQSGPRKWQQSINAPMEYQFISVLSFPLCMHNGSHLEGLQYKWQKLDNIHPTLLWILYIHSKLTPMLIPI